MLRFILAAAILLQASACDTFYAVEGTVMDASTGRPIASARVELELHDDGDVDVGAAETDDQGGFLIGLNTPESDLPSTLRVSREGFAPLTVEVVDPARPERVSLVPLEVP